VIGNIKIILSTEGEQTTYQVITVPDWIFQKQDYGRECMGRTQLISG